MEFELTKEAEEFIYSNSSKKEAFIKKISNNYYLEDSQKMEDLKEFVLMQIASNPIAYVNLNRLNDLITDALYNNK